MSKLIDKAIQEMDNISEDKISDDIKGFLEILNDNNLESLLNQNLFEILPQELKNRLMKIDSIVRNNDEKNFKIISGALYIAKIFSEKSIKEGVIFLWPVSVIFHYLRVKPNFLTYIVKKEDLSKIVSNIHKFLFKIDDNFNVPKNTPYIEQEYLKMYQIGITNDDLNNVYLFIESVERGRGIYPNFFVIFLAQVLLIEPSKWFSFLKSIIKPFTIVKYMNIIENKLNKEFIDLIIDSDNKWTIFEYSRQIIKDIKLKDNLKDDEIMLISRLFEKLYNIDEDFFINGIIFLAKYENKKCLGVCIGTFLSNSNDQILIKKMIDAFGIDDRKFLIDLWTFIGKTLEKEKKELLESMSQFIFIKWDNFLKEQFWNAEIKLGLVFTDYLNIVIWYLQECLSKDKSKFLGLLEEKLDVIINYKSYWVKNPSRKRIICLSYVYNMSHAWKNVYNTEIDSQHLNDKLRYILDDKRLYLSLPNYEDLNKHILKIKDNFGIKNFLSDES